ncbi:MAG: hypothetical protein CM1200mP27_03880 [Chloroflexota bacterium]|nr:MAG: hypothetical protein CM1200mP27_03880 [Chloroflexota bacterium]
MLDRVCGLGFPRQERGTNIERGREVVKRELRRFNQTVDDTTLLALFKVDSMDDFKGEPGVWEHRRKFASPTFGSSR